jgi:integrase
MMQTYDPAIQDARRTWAIMQYNKGIALEHIALLLGHKSLSTTRRLVAGEEVEYADILANAI